MAKIEKTVGTGITAVTMTMCSGEDLVPALKGRLARWETSVNDGGGMFGAVTQSMVQQSEAILASAGDGPHAEDSAADFAQRLLKYWRVVKNEISKGNADHAARFAFNAGYLFSQAVMKFEWEQAALEGRRIQDERARQQRDARERRAEILAAYEAALADGLRPKAAYGRLADEFGLTDDAVKERCKVARRDRRKNGGCA